MGLVLPVHNFGRNQTKRLQGKLTYSNVMVTVLAFVVLGGGTAYAATSMLPENSVGSKQIKKESVTPAKLSTAAKATLTGPQGSQGKEGPQGKEGAPGVKGEAGERGEPGPAVEILPSGQTEVGVWAAAAPSGSFGAVAINFVPRLAGPVPFADEVYLSQNDASAECPGFRRAASGYLCVYASSENQMSFDEFRGGFGVGQEPADPTGTVFFTTSTEAQGNARGNWAYTAP